MKLRDKQGNHKIAIVGMSSILPGSHNQQQLWENIVKGRDMIRDTPESHWRIKDYFDPSGEQDMSVYTKTGGFLDPILFDPVEFGMPPNIVPVTDTVQLLSLITARDVLNDTKSYSEGKVDNEKVSVILGVAAGTENMENMGAKVHWPEVVNTLRANGIEEALAQKIAQETRESYSTWNENTFPGLLSNVVAGRIANRFDFGGTNCTMDAACASSMSAIKNAMQELQLGNVDMVLSGGADALSSIFMYMCFNQTGALSHSGDCRAFDNDGDGTILGEGLAFFTLKRLEDAIEQDDRIYAVLAGMGSSSDGKSKSIYAPDSNGQAKAIRRAHEISGTVPEDIELIEAHGTGTVAGDFAEFNGLKLAFGDQEKSQFCALGSIKSQIGHTKSTAGAASLQKVVLALYNRVIPPTIKVKKPNEKMDVKNSPFYLNTVPKPWVTDKELRRAGVSSFGFGGTNFHGIIEEYLTDDHKSHYVNDKELFLLSADNKASLREKIEEMDAQWELNVPVRIIAQAYQEDFDPQKSHRLAIITASKHDFLTIKKTLLSLLSNGKTYFEIPNQVYYSSEERQDQVAVVCAGQGSQYLNMGRELLTQFPDALDGYAITSDLRFDGKRLDEVTFPISAFNKEEEEAQQKELNDTRWAQPTIGNLTVAHKQVMDTIGLNVAMVAGHSYGELSALYWSGAIKTPHDLVAISRKRGDLMATASSEQGAMTAVFTNGAKTEQLIKDAKSSLQVANYNGPDQTVVSGKLADIQSFEEFLAKQNQEFKRLPVSTAFHSSLVADSASDFESFLSDFSFGKFQIDVFRNGNGEKYKKSKKAIIDSLSGQLKSPVRFTEEIENMYQEGARVFLEVGPGNNLTNLVKQILEDKKAFAISLDGNKKQNSKDAFWVAMGQLSVAGIPLAFSKLWDQFTNIHAIKRDYSAVAVEISGANYKKPYPANMTLHAPVLKTPDSPAKPAVAPSIPDKQLTNQQRPPEPTGQNENTNIPNQHQPRLMNTITLTKMSQNSNGESNNPGWVSAFSQVQQSMHNSQMEFMRMMIENQNQFLQLSVSLLSNQPAALQAPVPSLPTPGSVLLKAQEENKVPATMPQPGQVQQPPMAGLASTAPAASAQPEAPLPMAAPQAAPAPSSAPAPVAKPQAVDIQVIEQKLVEIVAEKTGYPAEVLDLDAQLESGLGIDSIKRVQILSSLQKEYSELKNIDSTQLAKMNTLREILDYSSGFLKEDVVTNSQPKAVPVQNGSTSDEATAGDSLDVGEVENVLVAIVAEKTGYPAEVLDLDAQLESGLGIDSIKRVQILSELQKKYPALKNADTSLLAKMNTLKEILDYAVSSFGEEGVKKKSSTLPDMM